ncbi:hypothetical protein [Candidatus Chlorohelix sp.]|uniref:hypothetical protein n=1 Tax=Candidatus Chlorohelix sp. TaxID=3139201 RepID=UPI00304660F8
MINTRAFFPIKQSGCKKEIVLYKTALKGVWARARGDFVGAWFDTPSLGGTNRLTEQLRTRAIVRRATNGLIFLAR